MTSLQGKCWISTKWSYSKHALHDDTRALGVWNIDRNRHFCSKPAALGISVIKETLERV